MAQKICENCKHFILHYVRRGKRYIETGSGHCIYPQIKLRRTDAKACEHFK